MGKKLNQEWIDGPKKFRQSIKILKKYVDLKRHRTNNTGHGRYITMYRAYCPFCTRKKKSKKHFSVYENVDGVGIWKCFSTGASGDIFNFIKKLKHITFAESVLSILKESKGNYFVDPNQLSIFQNKKNGVS